MEEEIAAAIAIALVIIVAVFLSYLNWFKQRKLYKKLDQLNSRLFAIEEKIHDQKGAESPLGESTTDASPETTETIVVDEEVQDLSGSPEPTAAPDHWDDRPRQSNATAAPEPKTFEKLESDLSSKWMIWVGGIALALGGGFLVKYSIDANLMKPSVRVVLGLLFGAALTGLGDVARRKRTDLKWLDGTPDYLPSAISAAGLFILFAAVYSAYALYHLIPALVAFGALAIVSAGATALAFLQGRFFAYIGLIGALAAPALVSTGGGSAWTLFPYLLFIATASLFVARNRAWIDVAATSITLASLWAILWIVTNWHVNDVLPVGLYLLALIALNIIMLRGASPHRSTDAALTGLVPSHPISFISDGMILLCLILITSIVRMDHYSTFSFLIFGIAFLGIAYAMKRNPEHDNAGLAALIASWFLLATWHLPDLFEIKLLLTTVEAYTFVRMPIAPPGFNVFTTTALLLAIGVGGALFATLPKTFRKPLWASVGAGYPILILITAYGRLNDFDTSIPFALTAMVLAGVFTYAVLHLSKNASDDMNAPLAAYAAGATSAIALALSMVLRDAWLSFALALEIVALAHIWRVMKIDGLRYFALVISAVVLVRLFLNSYILDYTDLGTMPAINWLFYGYGLTALFFAYSAKMFKRSIEQDILISVLKAGSVMLAIAFTTLEIRVLCSEEGSWLGKPSELETALQAVNWSAATAILLWLEIKSGDKLIGLLRRAMTVVSLFGIFIAGGLFNNIFFGKVDVGTKPIFNLQLFQFFVPALLYATKTYLSKKARKKRSQYIYGSITLLTFFIWISVEVRHLFYPLGGPGNASNWELYCYSAAWLAYAVILLFSGIRLATRHLRMAGLGLLGLVVVKVFLFDMSHLEGVARALSFIGLGGMLIGIGYLYQKFKGKEAA